MTTNIFVGRQPIFDRKSNVFSYELLYRNSLENKYPDIKPEKATLELLINTFLNIGYEGVADKTKVFVNFTEKMLFDDIMNQLDARAVVIELLEDIEITDTLLRQLKWLRKKGFTIALDDFIISKANALYDELYKTVHIIKVDVQNTSNADKAKIEALTGKYRHLTLLAEKIETDEEYQKALKLGYRLFQGYFFSKPEIIEGKNIVGNHSLEMRLLKKLNEQEPDVTEITSLIKQDVSLSYKLLSYINSFAFEMPNKISSIRQALVIMGFKKAKKWLQLLLVYDIGNGDRKGRKRALVEKSIVRANMCELLAEFRQETDTDEYFLLGLFSNLNVIMNESWEKLLPRLSLTDRVEAALLGEYTLMHDYLKLIIAVEALDSSNIQYYANKLAVPIPVLSNISLTAHQWAAKF